MDHCILCWGEIQYIFFYSTKGPALRVLKDPTSEKNVDWQNRSSEISKTADFQKPQNG